MYKEINGKLCKLEADSPGIGASREISEILFLEENDIAFTVENEGIVFKVSLVKQDGNWRIDEIEETDTIW